MLYIERDAGVLLALLPGDSLGFDFGKPEWTNPAVCCDSCTPISCEFVPCVGGLLLWYFLYNTYPPQCLSRGRGQGLALRAALCQCANMPAYMHECVHIRVL